MVKEVLNIMSNSTEEVKDIFDSLVLALTEVIERTVQDMIKYTELTIRRD